MRLKTDLAEMLRVPEAAVRVVAQDVGGNYGTRNSSYPEYALVAWAARKLGRPTLHGVKSIRQQSRSSPTTTIRRTSPTTCTARTPTARRTAPRTPADHAARHPGRGLDSAELR